MQNDRNTILSKNSVWINPIGGLGDMLMVAGVLWQIFKNDPQQRFQMVRRTHYTDFFFNHPAIAELGYPPPGSSIIGTDYWSSEPLGTGLQRAYQIMARIFGLATPASEVLYFPGGIKADPLLWNMLPLGRKNILVCPTSDSPRKALHPHLWTGIVRSLLDMGCFVAQVGKICDPYITGTYSIRGLTTPHQLIGLIRQFDVVLTADNFIMHAAHLVGSSAVVLWGPTDPNVYGYPEQLHIQAKKNCAVDMPCIGPGYGHLYGTVCPLGERGHCMNQIDIEQITTAVNDKIMCKTLFEERNNERDI